MKVLLCAVALAGQSLYDIPDRVETRWISFENLSGAKGQGARTADGRKGSFYRAVKSGETLTLADIQGPGVIRRFWATVRGVPEILRHAARTAHRRNHPD